MYNPELRTYLFEALGWGWGWGSTSVVLPSWSSIKIPVQYRVDCRVESVPAIFWCFCSVPIQFIFVYWIPPNAQSWRLLIWACCNLRGVKILIFQIDEQRKHQTQIWPLSVFELWMKWIFTLSSSVACPLYSKSRQDSCWRSWRYFSAILLIFHDFLRNLVYHLWSEVNQSVEKKLWVLGNHLPQRWREEGKVWRLSSKKGSVRSLSHIG